MNKIYFLKNSKGEYFSSYKSGNRSEGFFSDWNKAAIYKKLGTARGQKTHMKGYGIELEVYESLIKEKGPV